MHTVHTSYRPRIAIPSFPGSNGEVDNVKTLKRCGFDCFIFRWNDSLEKLHDVDGYFFGAGFSYEDRGRSGMVAARDPLFRHMHEEALRGKVIIGNCNGAQVLVESGLIPLGDGLRMSLARNAIRVPGGQWHSPGFLNEWVWITPSCATDRCATSGWTGAMHIPIAHGEGRFVTRDPDLIAELRSKHQIAFQYCDAKGVVSSEPPITPNGSTMGIAGICNPEGNVVALMPHPERTEYGDPYFVSARRWIERYRDTRPLPCSEPAPSRQQHPAPPLQSLPIHQSLPVEIFIDTIITNNEERTVEQAARRIEPSLRLKQYAYIGLQSDRSSELLGSLLFFNPQKQIAYVRKQGLFFRWNSEAKSLRPMQRSIFTGVQLLRRDQPDTSGESLGGETGVCYDCSTLSDTAPIRSDLCDVFANIHASILERMQQ